MKKKQINFIDFVDFMKYLHLIKYTTMICLSLFGSGVWWISSRILELESDLNNTWYPFPEIPYN